MADLQPTGRSWADEVEEARTPTAGDDDDAGTSAAGATADEEAAASALSKLSGQADREQLKSFLINNEHDVQLELNDPNSNYSSATSFEELGLSPELLEGLRAMKFVRPSKIQEKALPLIFGDPPQNLIAQSQSGTGKTAAFVLGMLHACDFSNEHVQAICVCNSRELAVQNLRVIEEMGQFTDNKPFLCVKDVKLPKKQKLKNHMLIGTPGSIINAMRKKCFDPKQVRVFVVDEADTMVGKFSMGDQTQRIQTELSPTCQRLLFSATFPDVVWDFALGVVSNPNTIRLKRSDVVLSKIRQYYVKVDDEAEKYEILKEIFAYLNVGQMIIFCARRRTCSDLADRLEADNFSVSYIYGGDMDSAVRDQRMEDFRTGVSKVLISTNVIARGIDVLSVNLVVNYDIPTDGQGNPDHETYIHRIGRTARFGRSGVAINILHDQDSTNALTDIVDYYSNEGVPMRVEQLGEDDIEALGEALKKAPEDDEADGPTDEPTSTT